MRNLQVLTVKGLRRKALANAQALKKQRPPYGGLKDDELICLELFVVWIIKVVNELSCEASKRVGTLMHDLLI